LKDQKKNDNTRATEELDSWKSVESYKDILRFYPEMINFATGDEKVDAAAIILRALYILDVRNAQNQFSEIITYLQRYTADPKTNTKIGKVGW